MKISDLIKKWEEELQSTKDNYRTCDELPGDNVKVQVMEKMISELESSVNWHANWTGGKIP